MKSNTPELIQALTPIFIATIGGIIGVAILFVVIWLRSLQRTGTRS